MPYQIIPRYNPISKGSEINKGRCTPISPNKGKGSEIQRGEQIITIWIGQESMRIPLNPYPNTGRELYLIISNYLTNIQDPRAHALKDRRFRNSNRVLIPNNDDPLNLLPDMTLYLMTNTTAMLI